MPCPLTLEKEKYLGPVYYASHENIFEKISFFSVDCGDTINSCNLDDKVKNSSIERNEDHREK